MEFHPIVAVAGRSDQFTLRHLILNLLLFLVTLVATGLLVFDLFFRFEPGRMLVELGLTLLVGTLYGLARFRGVFGPLVWAASLAGLVFEVANYFANGGLAGSSWTGAFFVVGLVAVLHPTRWAVVWGLAAVLVQLGCLAFELLNPGLVEPYLSEIDRRLDLSLTFVLCGATFFGLIRMVMDFYERSNQKASEALRQSAHSEERRRLAMAAARDGHWDWDLVGGTIFYSTTWKALLGYTDEELPTRQGLAKDLTPPDHWRRIEEEFQAQEAAGATRVRAEFPMRHRNGSLVDILANTLIVRDEAGRVVRYVGTHSDVTELNRTLRDLTAARIEADRANQAKSEFLASMSHELRTPLNAILGFGQVLQTRTVLQPSQKELVTEITSAGTHLLDLITELIDLAQVESGQVTVRLQAVDPASVASECLSLARALAPAGALDLSIEVRTDRPVLADRLRLKQVLLNLLSNAVKYNRPGGLVRLTVEDCGDGLRFTVADTGVGIAPELQGRLFQLFDRLGREGGAISGSGIGLTYSRRLTKLMGGNLGFESSPGTGSQFWIDLPAAPQGTMASREAAEPADAVLPVASTVWTVLSVEDNPSNRKLVAQALGHRPHLVLVEARTGAEALELFLREKPAVVLLDLDLPDLSGYEVLRRLRAEQAGEKTAVLAVTAQALDRDRAAMAAAGFDGCLTKPFQLSELQDEVDRLLAGRPSVHPPEA